MNKNNVIAVLVVLCLVGSIWGSLMSKKSNSLEKKLSVMTGELEDIRQKHLSLTKNLDSKDKNVRDMRNKLQDASTGSDQLKAHLATSTDEMFRLQSSLEEAGKKAEELRTNLAASQEKLQTAEADLQLSQEKMSSLDESAQQQINNLRATIEKRNNALSAVNHELELAGVKANVEALQRELASRTADVGKFAKQKNVIAARESSLQETQKQMALELEQAHVKITEQEEALDGKNRKLDQYTKELSQLQVNMDVLLSEISKQKGILEKMTRKQEAYAKSIAGKDKQIEVLRSKLAEQNTVPAQQL
jgi:chromosome segregation ATPase